jgi:hypothetical protein
VYITVHRLAIDWRPCRASAPPCQCWPRLHYRANASVCTSFVHRLATTVPRRVTSVHNFADAGHRCSLSCQGYPPPCQCWRLYITCAHHRAKTGHICADAGHNCSPPRQGCPPQCPMLATTHHPQCPPHLARLSMVTARRCFAAQRASRVLSSLQWLTQPLPRRTPKISR